MSPATKPPVSVGNTVDWKFAASVGEKLARPGPAATDYTRRQVIEQLAEASRNAELPVRKVTELHEGAEIPEARIVDRPEWVRAATQSMRVMTGGSEKPKSAVGGRITGLLVDYHLDRGNGIAAIRDIRLRFGDNIPAILITADRSPHVRSAAREENIAVLNKPVKPASLRALLGQWRTQQMVAAE